MNAYRASLAATVAFGSMLVAPTAASAEATSSQEQKAASPAPDEPLTEIIVTAQKREQRLQDVPIAVTALTGETLNVNDSNLRWRLSLNAASRSTVRSAIPISGLRA